MVLALLRAAPSLGLHGTGVSGGGGPGMGARQGDLATALQPKLTGGLMAGHWGAARGWVPAFRTRAGSREVGGMKVTTKARMVSSTWWSSSMASTVLATMVACCFWRVKYFSLRTRSMS